MSVKDMATEKNTVREKLRFLKENMKVRNKCDSSKTGLT